ncbi:MAG: hypothetical protein MJ177_01605 [Clostridia bacterium]|nr:hypothetical protein [Clostridia bacterium]
MKRKIKIFFRRLRSMSFKRMNSLIGKIHSETGVPRICIFFDMIWCSVHYGMGYLDYTVFGFARVHGKKRKTYMTMNDNLSIVHRFNNKDYYYIFDDKMEFNRRFSDYIGRKWLNLKECDAKELERFCSGHKTVFVKQTETFGGQGIERIDLSEISDYAALYDRLTQNKQFLVEETIVQHEGMNALYSGSINTLRMVTLNVNGKVHFMYALVRMGKGGSAVDNISSGGMYTCINDSGVLTKPAFCDKTGEYYDIHPTSGTVFKGFEIPCFKQAVELVKKAALVEPNMCYVGWDVAITPDGPVLVEGNNFPSYDMVQNHMFTDNGEGILPKFKAVLEG